jgi:hypothetical protein
MPVFLSERSVVVAELGVVQEAIALNLGPFIGVPEIFNSLKLFKMFSRSTKIKQEYPTMSNVHLMYDFSIMLVM